MPSSTAVPRAARERFGAELRRAREAVGLVQSDLGLMSGSSVSRIETGERLPDRQTVVAWAERLRAPELVEVFDECIRVTTPSARSGGLFERNYRISDCDLSLRLTKEQPECYQVRRLVAFAPLKTITSTGAFFRVAGKRPDVTIEANEGCQVSDLRWITEELATWQTNFPIMLRAGETWRYSVTVRVSAMVPKLILASEVGFDHAALRILFPADATPTVVSLSGAPPLLTQDHSAAMRAGVQVGTDPFGLVEAEYKDLRPGLSYGLLWEMD